MRYIISGGGTAGHIYPALTVAEALSASAHDEVLFVGTPDGLEARLVPEAGISFTGLPARGYDRSRPFTLVTSSAGIAASTVRALGLIARFKPEVMVGFGGYVSLAIGTAAVLRRVPLVVHEQNAVPGLANSVLSRWADAVAATYESSVALFRRPDLVRVTGNPVRPCVLGTTREDGRETLGLPADALVLLVFGGSRGARHLNRAVASIAERILELPTVYVVHLAGEDDLEGVRSSLASDVQASGRWRLFAYLSDMGAALGASDLVVARAGSTSIAEITALGRPAVLVPYPYATEDHQTKNAQVVVEAGGAVLIPDAELGERRFGDTVTSLLTDHERRATMAAASRKLGRPGAASEVVELVREAARSSGEGSSDIAPDHGTRHE